MRLDHCCLNVHDLDRAIAFYVEHFQMELLSRREIKATNAEIAFVGYPGGEMKLELTHWRDWGPEDYDDGSVFDHIALVVEDCRGLIETLRDAGVEVAKEPFEVEGSGSVIAFVRDLEGTWIELVERN